MTFHFRLLECNWSQEAEGGYTFLYPDVQKQLSTVALLDTFVFAQCRELQPRHFFEGGSCVVKYCGHLSCRLYLMT